MNKGEFDMIKGVTCGLLIMVLIGVAFYRWWKNGGSHCPICHQSMRKTGCCTLFCNVKKV